VPSKSGVLWNATWFHPRERFGFREGTFPQAEAAGASMLALPFHGNLAADDAEYVVACVAEEVETMKVGR